MNGQCYPNSFKYMSALALAREAEQDPVEKHKFDDLVLIHGNVIPTEGPDEGRLIDHAWIEMAEYSLDVAEDIQRPAAKPIEEYHRHFSAKVRALYSLDQARLLLDTSGMYGPWDDEGRHMRSLSPLQPETYQG